MIILQKFLNYVQKGTEINILKSNMGRTLEVLDEYL